MKKVTLAIVVLMNTILLSAQEISDRQVSAFENSYTFETAKEYDKAIAALKAVGIYNEKSYEINLRLGWLYYEKADYTNSEVYYKLATIQSPNSVEALLGYIYPTSAAQNWDAVFKSYEKILSIEPTHTIANYRIALMYYYRKEYANAEKHLKKVLDHYPFDFDCLLLLAQTKVAAGKMAEAKTYYLKAQLYSPANEEIKKALSKM